jgi:hypothetical protein
MNKTRLRKTVTEVIFAVAIVASMELASLPATAQNPEVQQRLADVKEASAKNKQSLATYTWQEQDTISVKGEVKKQESFQVQNRR